MSIRTAIYWVASILFAVVLAPVIGDFFVEFARQKGAYDDPGATMNELVAALISIAHTWWYPYFLGLFFGLILGMWLDHLTKSARSSTKSERFCDLSWSIGKVRDDWVNGFATRHGGHDFSKHNQETWYKLKALYSELKKLGLRPPDYSDLPREQANIGHYGYLQCLQHFASRGLLREAKREAKKNIDEVRAAARGNPPR